MHTIRDVYCAAYLQYRGATLVKAEPVWDDNLHKPILTFFFAVNATPFLAEWNNPNVNPELKAYAANVKTMRSLIQNFAAAS